LGRLREKNRLRPTTSYAVKDQTKKKKKKNDAKTGREKKRTGGGRGRGL